jgi:hypothetical protein
VGTGIIWSKTDLELGAIDRGSGGCCDNGVEVAKPDFNKESFAQPFLGIPRSLQQALLDNLERCIVPDAVSLPVDPTFKTWSEASTIAFLRAKTTIPVPKVIVHCSSRENEIGFEWMLMERAADAHPLREVWRSLPWVAKTKLVEDVADILGHLFSVRADAIGSIYQLDTASCKEKKAASSLLAELVQCHSSGETTSTWTISLEDPSRGAGTGYMLDSNFCFTIVPRC